jgi:hypothetical protein
VSDKSFKDQVKSLDTTSRAGQLARDLNIERHRLKEELAEAQEQVDIFAPSTPTGGFDSIVKWVATVLAVIGVFLISAGLGTLGQVSYACSAIAWVYVGHCWNDKAIMIGSAITGTAVMMNLVELLIAF